jgi:hypothetical protein
MVLDHDTCAHLLVMSASARFSDVIRAAWANGLPLETFASLVGEFTETQPGRDASAALAGASLLAALNRR